MSKATIVIPNINGKGWLKDSIESIYAQTEQDFDLRRARDTPSSVNGKTHRAGHPCTDGIFPAITGNTGVLAGTGRCLCGRFGCFFGSL